MRGFLLGLRLDGRCRNADVYDRLLPSVELSRPAGQDPGASVGAGLRGHTAAAVGSLYRPRAQGEETFEEEGIERGFYGVMIC